MSVFLSPVGGAGAQFFDNNGSPLTGGKLYTYAAGTTTPQATYTTSAGNVARTNPILLDAAGRIPGSGEIWLSKDVDYKFVVYDSNDVLIGTYDNLSGVNDVDAATTSYTPAITSLLDGDASTVKQALDLVSDQKDGSSYVGFIQAGANAQGRSAKDKLREWVSVKDFGAVGDNTTDDTAAIQAAIDYVTNGTVFFPAGQYKITSTLKINYSNITFKNCVNLLGAGQGSSIYWHGPNNLAMVWYKGTTVNAGLFSTTIVEKLYFKNQNASTGLIGIRLGNAASPFPVGGGGVANVTIRNNVFIDMAVGIQTEYQSNGINIEENIIRTFSAFGVYNVGSACMRVTKNYFEQGKPGSVAVYAEYTAITVSDNLIQSTEIGVTGDILLKNVAGFTINNNYLEHGYTGPAWSMLLQNSSSGYIGSNVIQGFQGADAIYVDVNSYNVNIGPNTYGFFGFPMASLVRADGATGVNVLGNQNYILSPVSISNGTPAVITSTLGVVGMQSAQAVFFTTTGTLPTGLTVGTTYYVRNVVGASFEVSATVGGPAISTSSAGSGVHTCHILLVDELRGPGFNFSFNNDYVLHGVNKYTATPNSGITMSRNGIVNIGAGAVDAGWGYQTYNRDGVQIGSVSQVGTAGVIYNTSSDHRLKEITGPLTGARDFIMALKPKQGAWKADGTPFAGFLAHEFQEVSPSSVVGVKDAVDASGKPVYQSMQASSPEVIANIVALLQEQQSTIEQLQAELSALKGV